MRCFIQLPKGSAVHILIAKTSSLLTYNNTKSCVPTFNELYRRGPCVQTLNIRVVKREQEFKMDGVYVVCKCSTLITGSVVV